MLRSCLESSLTWTVISNPDVFSIIYRKDFLYSVRPDIKTSFELSATIIRDVSEPTVCGGGHFGSGSCCRGLKNLLLQLIC
jgi:hypothetical protein